MTDFQKYFQNAGESFGFFQILPTFSPTSIIFRRNRQGTLLYLQEIRNPR